MAAAMVAVLETVQLAPVSGPEMVYAEPVAGCELALLALEIAPLALEPVL